VNEPAGGEPTKGTLRHGFGRLANTAKRGRAEDMGAAKKKCIRCEDCYFKQNMLCALNLDAPCPTYRPADRGLRPEKQLAFVFRMDRTQATYAFPQPQGRWS
jgi:hypothetical protein